MKSTARLLALLLALLCLTGCGKTAAAPNLQQVYNDMTAVADMPDMLPVPSDRGAFLFGIAPDDCVQEIVALCQNSLLADELWLIEAVDKEAADRIETLARGRLDQKSAELKNYAPEQYQLVQQAKLIREGNCVVMIVSPLAKELEGVLREQIG